MVRPSPRLPGVYVETVRPPPAETLPRMDVAGFVGFAASGPIGLPTPVEDLARFREVFGPDLRLARDRARGEERLSLLGPAVESFFADGGRRAVILRVADAARAATLAFPIPGLVDEFGAGAVAPARSPGLWPEDLAADARLVRRNVFPAPGGALTRHGPDGRGLALPFLPGGARPRRGDLLEIAFPEAGLLALLAVDEVETVAGAATARGARARWRRALAGAPASPAPAVAPAIGADDPNLVAAAPGAFDVEALLDAGPPPVPAAAAVLTFDLALWRGARIAHRLDGLGFVEGHPRWWADLPADAELFAVASGRPARRRDAEAERFRAEASSPRFPLAGPASPAALWLPDGMPTATDRARARPPLPPAEGDRLALEGLAPPAEAGEAPFLDRLFLDPRLATTPAGALAAEMEARHAEGAEPLAGLHALGPAAEISMLAAPDAVHPRWSREAPAGPPPLAAPALDPLPDALDPFGRLHLSWSAVPEAARYRVELAGDAAFTAPAVALAEGESAALPLEADCPVPVAARVRAERDGELGPWSNTRLARLPAEDFAACEGTHEAARLVLRLVLDAGPPPRLLFRREPPAPFAPGDRVELQSGAAPGLEDAAPVPGHDPEAEAYAPDPAREGGLYFRARLRRGALLGPWSETVRMPPSGFGDWALRPDAEHDDAALVAIHRAMIRFAAGRADLVALLALPRHYREPEIERHLARLSPLTSDAAAEAGAEDAPAGALRVPGLRFGETGALSYAALLHPWIAVETGAGAFRTPDGPMAGLMAAQALGPGAWIAAANRPVAGALALDPALDDATLARLIDRQVNPLRRDPRGFLFFNAETLSPEDDLRPLPVRRLMILLRRLALREGAAYVFEPHDADFRARVRRRFEAMLSGIHRRGGFAGPTPEASFRVVADESVNPPSAVDLGRFQVELRVAPARPFRWLNLRLLRTGPERLTVEEA